MFFKIGVLKNSTKFKGKHLCQSLFFNANANLLQIQCKSIDWSLYDGACNFVKKEALAQVFSREFCEIFKNTFFYRALWVAASVMSLCWKPG